ncbi:Nidogen-2 [Portunus trituberculatus]|uniref:Nidogen-2 n=1 Tax=Portunus trituberculatus TaxID=210409 RepID=A0A5B7ECC7_PORTR|nr:Nidogen-2 [Portunus trituberculatus]
MVKEALETALKESNYSLGGTGLFTSRAAAILASEDFNECIVEGHNDCSPNANCFNTPGSYLCACKDGFKDISDVPGRECAEQCAQCNFQGECVTEPDGSVGCRCLQWFSGNRCQLNLRVMLIALVTVGALLILLLLLCVVLCCLRARRNAQDKLAQVWGLVISI